MKKYCNLIFVVSIAAVMPACGKKAPEKVVKAEKSPPAAQEVVPKFTPASLSSGTIDPKFKGVSPSILVSSLERLQDIKKGEFEKTEDFNKRKANALSVKLFDDYGVDDVFPLVVEVSKYSTCLHGIMYGYNPDSSKATLHLSAYPESYGDRNFISGYDSQKYDTFELVRDYQKDRTYIGSNAFGVQAEVTQVDGVIYTVASKKIDFVPGKRTLSCFEKEALFKFSMDAETAAKELPTLKALIMLKVKPPFVLYENFHKGATRSDPTETKVLTKALYGDVIGMVIYSGTTGKIVTHFPLPKK